jgi:phage major head subunit gpT-like protein
MPIQNQSTIDVASTTFNAVFDEVFAAQPPGPWSLYTEVVQTQSKINELDVLETMPVVREWIGSKVFQSIRASSLSATVKKYEKSFAIDRLDLQADRTGQIGRRIRMFVSDAGQIYDKICLETLVSASGAGPLCYDGVRLFSASHPRSAGTTWSNLTTNAFSFTQHDTIMQAGAALRDDNSEPLRIAYDTLIVGPKLFKLASEVTQSTERIIPVAATGIEAAASVVTAAAIPNVYGGGQMTLVVDPRLTGTFDDYYYYLDTSRGPKPLMMFEFRSPEAIDQMSMDSDGRFNDDLFKMSVEADFVVTAGSPHVAYAGIL